jgi:hypothetical protein
MSRKTHGTIRPSSVAQQSAGRAGGGSREDFPGSAAYAFLVRLWKEPREITEQHPVWRGTLSDLQGHSIGSFGTVEELGELLTRATGAGAWLLLRRHGDGEP